MKPLTKLGYLPSAMELKPQKLLMMIIALKPDDDDALHHNFIVVECARMIIDDH